MNYIDVVIIVITLAILLRGIEAGFARQACSLLGLIGGIAAGSLLSSLLHFGAMASLITIILSIMLVIAIVEYGGMHIIKHLQTGALRKADGLLGGLAGLVMGLLFVWFSSSLVSAVPSPSLQEGVRNSRIIAKLDATLPPTTTVMRWLNTTLAQTKIPDIVKGLEPNLPNLTADVPNVQQFSGVIASSKASVVEIDGRSCSGLAVGSGFVAAPGIVITNAHVVAGMLHPFIEDDNGRHKARIVGFDPDLDIAVLRADNLAGTSLTILDSTIPNGTSAVALGYPGGGPLTASPAAVIDTITAISPNIYNEGSDKRQVYALKADIEPGNSGGPLLDTKGQVVGVIFARSTTYNQVGYALSTPAVQQVLNHALAVPSSGQSARCAVE